VTLQTRVVWNVADGEPGPLSAHAPKLVCYSVKISVFMICLKTNNQKLGNIQVSYQRWVVTCDGGGNKKKLNPTTSWAELCQPQVMLGLAKIEKIEVVFNVK
jgi:hypothetical protein